MRDFDKIIFQFLLCLLTISNDTEEIINNIISYCIVEKALSFKYDVLDIEELGYSEDTIHEKYHDYDFNKPLHNKFLKSANNFSITLGSIGRNIKTHYYSTKFNSNKELRVTLKASKIF